MGIKTNFSPLGSEGIKFLDWIQSDGSAYIDTGFVVPDYTTRFSFVAATFATTDKQPLFYSGRSTAMNAAQDIPGFGFARIYGDRQQYINIGKSRFWNSSAYSGNWNSTASNPIYHTISAGIVSGGTIPSLILDGSTISMTQEGGSDLTTMPTPTIAIFASHYTDGGFYMINSAYRLKLLSFSDSYGNVLCNLLPAIKFDKVGMFDTIKYSFHSTVGGIMNYGKKG